MTKGDETRKASLSVNPKFVAKRKAKLQSMAELKQIQDETVKHDSYKGKRYD